MPGDVDEQPRPLDDREGIVGGKVTPATTWDLALLRGWVVVWARVVVVGIGMATRVHAVGFVVASGTVPAVGPKGGVWFEVAILGPEVR